MKSGGYSKYQIPTTLGLMGIVIAMVIPALFKLPAQFGTFGRITQIQESEKLERSRIENRAETANKLAEAGVMPYMQRLKVRRYTDNRKRNPRIETTGWLEEDIVQVFDSNGKCIGIIEDRKWKWKYHYKNVCNRN